MKPHLKIAFAEEMRRANAAEEAGDLDRAFSHLERAHILGQRYFITHVRTHLGMLRIARRRRNGRETRGQITRLAAVLPGYIFGWVPKGNTGGANVSAMKPMPLPDDLSPMLSDYSVWRDVAGRAVIWLLIAALFLAPRAADLADLP